MVHPKKKSGDPDYDDKQPLEAHAGGTLVKSEDGREVFISDANGPVDEFGAHVALDGPTAEDLDNRPAPGEVAEKPSEVQTYSAEDTAPGKVEAVPLEQYRREQAEKNETAGATPDLAVAKPDAASTKTGKTSTK